MTTPSRSDETLFAAALERPALERAVYLDAACASDAARRARIEDLLRAHASAEKDFMATAASAAPRIAEPAAGQMIGRYKLLQKIGDGGCGTVYMAEQEEPVRRATARSPDPRSTGQLFKCLAEYRRFLPEGWPDQ